jgi:hypothetical protein
VSVGSPTACSPSYVGWLTCQWHSSSGVGLDDPRLRELYDLSKAAREMRGQLKSSLQQAPIAHKYGSLKDTQVQSICILIIKSGPFRGSMSRIHARRYVLTTYFDPFYADLYIHPNKPYPDRLGIDGPIERVQRSIAEVVA